MAAVEVHSTSAITQLRRYLPLRAHGRPVLLEFLRASLPRCAGSPTLMVTNLFERGDSEGVMAQFLIKELNDALRLFVAPVDQIAFDRRHPICRALAAHRERALRNRTPPSASLRKG